MTHAIPRLPHPPLCGILLAVLALAGAPSPPEAAAQGLPQDLPWDARAASSPEAADPPWELLLEAGAACRVDLDAPDAETAAADCETPEAAPAAPDAEVAPGGSAPGGPAEADGAAPEGGAPVDASSGGDLCAPGRKDCFHLFPPEGGEADPAAKRFLADVWHDQKAVWTAPAKMGRKEMFTIALPLAAAAAGIIAADARMSDAFPDSGAQRDNARIVGYFGDIYTLGAVSVAAMAGGKAAKKSEYARAGRNALEALAASVIANYALKAAAGRERPFENDGRGRFFSGGQSFPSGHSMNSWAVAAAIGRTPGCPRWFALTSYAMASVISASRLPARKHFVSDILVGGVLGGMIGNYVATRKR
ncbi:MAG: phosphatase PAP2 family protein [Acidobacteriota bacterium]|jgi:membrane-associated phospholipid phosphatase|nr:phosphatase PAP2 family protein [Acidobacteriota bacterium]